MDRLSKYLKDNVDHPVCKEFIQLAPEIYGTKNAPAIESGKKVEEDVEGVEVEEAEEDTEEHKLYSIGMKNVGVVFSLICQRTL